MYKIKIGLKYGSFSVKSNTYKECMENIMKSKMNTQIYLLK